MSSLVSCDVWVWWGAFVYIHVHVEARGQPQVSFRRHDPLCFSTARTCLMRLAGQQVLRINMSLPYQPCNYNCMLLTPEFWGMYSDPH